ncbi:MAG: hypothetical protein HZA91_13240 [Verrucomicrobia bacterium]|nr:hypothetical protein [Verrucomicrobiota bacterium]
MKTLPLAMLLLAGSAGWAAAAEDKPMYPAPKTIQKFSDVEVRAVPNPTWSPLEVESRLRWRTERELTARDEPNFKLGKTGLVIEVKFLLYEEPKAPWPPRRVPRSIPNPKGGGSILIGPEAEPMPVPLLGVARIQFSFLAPDGTQLAQYEFVDSVRERKEWVNDDGFIPKAARLAAHYARYYFLDPARAAPPAR